MHPVSADAVGEILIAGDKKENAARARDRQIAPRDRLTRGHVIIAKDDSSAPRQRAQDRLRIGDAAPIRQEGERKRRQRAACRMERARGRC